ncbi:MAG: hypothetical protein K8T25_23175, partial [Planctomycetia bacterium]|nr:hypothetical protein [Planctomycetia bacterium]
LAKGADVIVWCPDSFEAPSGKVIAWFDQWLSADPNRMLIYIGRDHESGPNYWQAVIPNAPANLSAELNERLAESISEAALRRKSPNDENCEWFKLVYSGAKRHAITW